MPTPFLFGGHERMKELERRIRGIARSGLPVLIAGACGTGKEALAGLIHELSECQPGFTRISCLRSGPLASNPVADLSPFHRNVRGTVFLKNVHLLAPAAQEQLLAAIEQAGDVQEDKKHEPAARLIASTTESMEPLVMSREFSAGLYYRLSVYRIFLPPLRERVGDIPELFARMARRAANGNGTLPAMTSRLMDALMAHEWPGNLRELQNVARAYVANGDAEETIAEVSSHPQPPPAAPFTADGSSLKEQVKGAALKLESEIILRTLKRHRWNRRRTAQSLQISYRSLLYKMKNCTLRMGVPDAPEGG